MTRRFVQWTLTVVMTAALAAPAFADRTQVYSLSKLHCVECGDEIGKAVKKVKGVKKYTFDYLKAEMTLNMTDAVTDAQIVAAVTKAGFGGEAGAGTGKYMGFEPYPETVDFAVLVSDGSRVGSLDSLRVAGKYTVFDVYAEWCMPCRTMDDVLHELVAKRDDVAIRRLNFVSWDSPLALQMEGKVKALPHLVIYAPDGTSQVVEGSNPKKLKEALAAAK